MKIRAAALAAFFCLGGATHALARHPGFAPQDTASLEVLPGPKALRVIIGNAALEYAEGARQARIKLVWELLPADSMLVVNRQNARRRPFRFRNEALEGRSRVPSGAGDPAALEQALESGDFSQFNESAWYQAFQAQWTRMGGAGYELAASSAILPTDYYAVLRDNTRLATLLGSGGAQFQVRGLDEPLFITDDIACLVERYRFVANDTAGRPIEYDRYTVRVEVSDVELMLPEGAGDVQLQLRGQLRNRLGTGTIPTPSFSSDVMTVTLADVVDEEVEKLERTEAESALDLLLRFGAGTSLGDIATRGLLGASRYTSISSGALITEHTIEAVVGVNFEPQPAWEVRPGLLVGVSPTGGGALYSGVSLSAKVFQLSFGLAAVEESRTSEAGEETSDLEFRFAGTLSFDLSRLSGQKRKKTTLSIANPAAGGGWGTASDMVARNLGLARLSFLLPDDVDATTVTLTRVRDADDRELEGAAQRTTIPLNLPLRDRELWFLPLGYYTVTPPDELRVGFQELDLQGNVSCFLPGEDELPLTFEVIDRLNLNVADHCLVRADAP
jgi:hypothetical protein